MTISEQFFYWIILIGVEQERVKDRFFITMSILLNIRVLSSFVGCMADVLKLINHTVRLSKEINTGIDSKVSEECHLITKIVL